MTSNFLNLMFIPQTFIQNLYTYMDTDGGGTIGYNEFTKLHNEKHMGIDPYTNQQQEGDEMDVFYKNQ